MRTCLTIFLATVLIMPVHASDQPNVPQAKDTQPKPVPASPAPASDQPPDAPRAKSTPASKAKAKPARRKTSAANARAWGMVDAAIASQGMQVMQAEANRQAAIRREQARLQDQRARQLDTIRRLSPQGTTVTRVRPDGSFETNTYYVYPNLYPLGLPAQP